MRVLIAEDDAGTRQLLESLLRRWDYEVEAASDGNMAWDMLQAPDAPKIALLDWMMPGVDGVEICRRVRQIEAKVPTYIIMLTIRDQSQDVVAGFKVGADEYITKPFNHDELRARVKVGQRIIELQTALAKRVDELEEAMGKIKTLSGLLPICSHCRKIRDEKSSWHHLDEYVRRHSYADFSHTVCPECEKKYYP